MATKIVNKKRRQQKIYECIGYTQDIDGIIDLGGQQVSVKGLIKGEKAYLDLKKTKGGMQGRIIKIVEPSDERVKSRCPHFLKCGGCQMLHIETSAQADIKQKIVTKQLKSFAKAAPIITMDQPIGYRNKAHYSFGYNQKGEIICGLYGKYSHDIFDVKRCLLHDKRSDAIANTVKQLMKPFGIEPFNEDKKSGHLRHLLIRSAKGTSQILVCLVTGAKTLPNQTAFIQSLLEEHPEITTVTQSVNTASTSMVLGRDVHTLYGDGVIEDKLLDLNFKISTNTFYQINSTQTEKLYTKAIKLAKLSKNDAVLDAYCGIGTIALSLADKVKLVTGVEINQVSVNNAKDNAERNSIKNANFIKADAAEYLRKMKAHIFDVVFIDPPRIGASKLLIDALIKHSPKRIVYIACNLTTQARDLKQLKRGGYKVRAIQPVDMFPMTNNIETVVLLSKLDVDKHISV